MKSKEALKVIILLAIALNLVVAKMMGNKSRKLKIKVMYKKYWISI